MCGRKVQDLLQLEVRSFNLRRDMPNQERPLEAGLHWMIGFRKPDFAGREAVLREKAAGLKRKLIGIALEGSAAAAVNSAVYHRGRQVGYVANCDMSPRCRHPVALAYLDPEYAWAGLEFEVETAGGRVAARGVSTPFLATRSMAVRMS